MKSGFEALFDPDEAQHPLSATIIGSGLLKAVSMWLVCGNKTPTSRLGLGEKGWGMR